MNKIKPIDAGKVKKQANLLYGLKEQMEEMADKIKANTFDFNDFIDQLDQVNKMGPLEDILKMIPGLNKIPGLNDLKVDPKDTARMKAIV